MMSTKIVLNLFIVSLDSSCMSSAEIKVAECSFAKSSFRRTNQIECNYSLLTKVIIMLLTY